MNSTLRSTAAAASVLLASVGAMMVATPAAAQQRAVVVAAPVRPQIERFVMQGPLARGSTVRFRLLATPGGEAWVVVPFTLRERLVETRPGVYEASYTLRGTDDPARFERATASFELQDASLSARAEFVGDRDDHYARRDDREPRRDDREPRRDDRDARRDVHPPQITDVTPAEGERVSERGWTRITARIGDRGTGVQSVLLRVDGRDVSARTRIEDDLVRYAEDLPVGRHNAELVVRDRAGNTARRSWSFEVADADWRHHDRHDRHDDHQDRRDRYDRDDR